MNDDTLIADVAEMGALAVADEQTEHGILPLDRLAHYFRAAIETYLIFASRPPAARGSRSGRGQRPKNPGRMP
jgi:hypothetical protein